MDQHMRNALDRHITGNYGEDQFRDEEPAPRCGNCGGWLRAKADKTVPWEDKLECDGKRYEVQHPGYVTLDIEPFVEVHFGVEEDSCPRGEHEPHAIVMMSGFTYTRKCRRCGHLNTEKEY